MGEFIWLIVLAILFAIFYIVGLWNKKQKNTYTAILLELQTAKNSMDYLNIWHKYQSFLEKNNAELIFAQDNFQNMSLPSIDMFENDTKRFKSLFQNNKFIFLNTKIFNDMQKGLQSIFKIDYTVSFDTQFASFIQKYFTGKQFSQEKEFEEILYKLIDHNVNSDYLPYILENVTKGESLEGIKENIKEIIRFFHLDKSTSHLLKNMRLIDTQTYELDYKNIIQNTIDKVDQNIIEDFKRKHEIMYIILMKIVIINKEKNSPKQKLTELIDYMHYSLNTIYDRELTVAKCFYEDQNKLKFFNGVHDINAKTLQKLENMAWDFALVRFLESAFSIRPNRNADFFLSYFLTFDEGLSQVIDTYPLKAIFITNRKKTLQVISNIDKTEFIKKYKLENHFSLEAYEYRNKHRAKNKLNHKILINELERQIQNYI